jgi:hypothetical protein
MVATLTIMMVVMVMRNFFRCSNRQRVDHRA